MTEVFFPIATLYGEHGDIIGLRVGFINYPDKAISVDKDIPYTPEKSVYFNLVKEIAVLPNMQKDYHFEDIDINGLEARLGPENVDVQDQFVSIFTAPKPIEVCVIECGGILTGTISFNASNDFAGICSDGTLISDQKYVVGIKKLERVKPRSRKKINVFDTSNNIYVIDAYGTPTLSNAAALFGTAPDANLFSNAENNGTVCDIRSFTVAKSGSNRRSGFKDTLSDIQLGMAGCVEMGSDPIRNYEPYISMLPEGSPGFLVPTGCIPISVTKISDHNQCKQIGFQGPVIDTIEIMSNQRNNYPNLGYIPGVGKGMTGQLTLGVWNGINLASSGKSSVDFDKVLFPDIAAGGIIFEANSVKEIKLPEYCSRVFALLLDRSEFKTFDISNYRLAIQCADLGSSPELTEVKLSGKGKCHFYGKDLAKLRSLSVSNATLEELNLSLCDLEQDAVDIDIDMNKLENQTLKINSPFGCYPNVSPDNSPDTYLTLSAVRPITVNIKMNVRNRIFITIEKNSAPINIQMK